MYKEYLQRYVDYQVEIDKDLFITLEYFKDRNVDLRDYKLVMKYIDELCKENDLEMLKCINRGSELILQQMDELEQK